MSKDLLQSDRTERIICAARKIKTGLPNCRPMCLVFRRSRSLAVSPVQSRLQLPYAVYFTDSSVVPVINNGVV